MYTKQLSLFFHKKGTSTPICHGSPMVKHYNKFDRVTDWQQYLREEVHTSAKKGFTSGGRNLRPDRLRPPYASRVP